MSEQAPAQCAPGQLWYPGLHLDTEYPVPSDEELCELWKSYSGEEAVRATTEVYGVYSVPDAKAVKAVASVDLCEVVRDTAISFDKATGLNIGRRGNYANGTWFAVDRAGNAYANSLVVNVVRAVIDSGLVEPVEDIGEICSIMQKWRSVGVYCVANTSTLPGCEKGTINHTLQRDLPNCFDGLVLPRNHDGNGTTTKAGALAAITAEAGINLSAMPFVHIDDATHHIAGFQAAFTAHPTARLFAPRHNDNQAISAELQCDSPLDAFQRADAYFQEQGVC